MMAIEPEQIETYSRIAILETEMKNLCLEFKEFRKEQKEQHAAMLNEFKALEDRLHIIEKWRWMVIGGSIAIGYIVSELLRYVK
jgi:hypothetical protein